jgi:hypothetical protein
MKNLKEQKLDETNEKPEKKSLDLELDDNQLDAISGGVNDGIVDGCIGGPKRPD